MTQIVTRQLDCGATLVVEPIDSVRSAAVVWMTPGGCALDPSDSLGLCAMLDELLLRGAGILDSRAQADAFDRLGVSRGCSTGTLSVSLSASLVADRLAQTLPLMADVVRKPRFEEGAIEPVRALALAEIEALADDPTERAMLAARARHWPHPLDRNTYGTVEGLQNVTRAQLVDHWALCARPKGSVIAIAGHVDADAIATQLNDLLEGWAGDGPSIVNDGLAPRGYSHIDDAAEQVQIIVVEDAPLETDEDAWCERLATQVLSGGMASRLFTEVREKRGLCYSVSASYRTDRLRGWRTSYVGTAPARAQESLDVLVEQLDHMTTPAGAVTQEEFDRAIAGLRSRMVFSGESTAARAGAIASDVYKIGRPRTLEEIIAKIESLTLNHVNDYLGRSQRGRATLQTLGTAALTPPASILERV